MNKEIILPVFELKEALPGLSKVVGRNRALPVLQTIKVARDTDGKVSLQATDLDAFATYTTRENQPGPAVEMLVPLEHLTKTAKTLASEGTINFTPEGKDKVKLRYAIGGSSVERSINSLAPEEFPSIPQVNQPSVPLEAGFGLALRQALQCCSEDSSRAILKGACLDVRDKKFHYVVGSNGRVLFSANSFCFDLKQSVVIPDCKFLAWTDFMDEEPASIAVAPGQEAAPTNVGDQAKDAGPGYVKLQSGPWTFIAKEIHGEFPNWKQCIPTPNDKWTKVILGDEAIRQLLLVTPSLPGDDTANHPVRLRVDRCLSIEGRAKDEDAWTSIPVQDVKITGEPVSIALNRTYLLNALRFGLNEVQIEQELSPMVFSKGGKRLVVMPVNMDGGKPTPTPVTEPAPTNPSSTNQETTPSAPPTVEAPTEERKEMPRTAKTTTEAAPENNGNGSAIKSLVEQVEQIKESLKGAIRDLATVVDTVKQAEKEKRTTEKEIEAIRTKLRQIQSVTI